MHERLKHSGQKGDVWSYDVKIEHVVARSMARPRASSPKPALSARAPRARRPLLTAEERVARHICRILVTEGRAERQRLRELVAAIMRTTKRRRGVPPVWDFNEGLEAALAKGWIVEAGGRCSLTEAGQDVARKTRAATGPSRPSRLDVL
jgi:hypothetical protein